MTTALGDGRKTTQLWDVLNRHFGIAFVNLSPAGRTQTEDGLKELEAIFTEGLSDTFEYINILEDAEAKLEDLRLRLKGLA